MKAPLSDRAKKLLSKPDSAKALIDAIRSARTERKESVTIPMDGRTLTVSIVRTYRSDS
jgi:hypothetical protein